MDTQECSRKLIDALEGYTAHVMFTQPIYLTIMLVTIIMVIVYAMYDPGCDHFAACMVKTSFWIAIVLGIGIFVSQQFIIKGCRKLWQSDTEQSLLTRVGGGPTEFGSVDFMNVGDPIEPIDLDDPANLTPHDPSIIVPT